MAASKEKIWWYIINNLSQRPCVPPQKQRPNVPSKVNETKGKTFCSNKVQKENQEIVDRLEVTDMMDKNDKNPKTSFNGTIV